MKSRRDIFRFGLWFLLSSAKIRTTVEPQRTLSLVYELIHQRFILCCARPLVFLPIELEKQHLRGFIMGAQNLWAVKMQRLAEDRKKVSVIAAFLQYIIFYNSVPAVFTFRNSTCDWDWSQVPVLFSNHIIWACDFLSQGYIRETWVNIHILQIV